MCKGKRRGKGRAKQRVAKSRAGRALFAAGVYLTTLLYFEYFSTDSIYTITNNIADNYPHNEN